MALPEPLSQLAEGPIFVIGSPRSGTTWIYDILTAHPEVAGALETWMFTQEHGLGSVFSWVHWTEAHLERGRKLTGTTVGLAQMVDRDEVVAEIRELAARWLSRLLKPNARYLVEKTPIHLFAAGVIGDVFPEARFVNIVRDGRDVAVSMKAAARTWNPGWRAATRNAYVTAKQWKTALEWGRAMADRFGEQFLEVRYEQLKTDPRGTTRTILDFCRIPCDDALMDQIVAETDFARMYRGGDDQFRRRGVAGDWRAKFGLLDAAAFHKAAGDELIRYGYEQSRDWWRHVPLFPRRSGIG